MAYVPSETPIRALEIVHRALEDSIRLGRGMVASLHSSEAASRSDGSKKVKSAKGSKTKVPDLISHWAVRIEREPGQGRDDDPTTWVYFGLVQSPDRHYCELTNEAFASDGRPEYRFRGYTLWDPQDIDGAVRAEAKMLIDAATRRGYNIRDNNCQDFAVSLFLSVCHQANSADEMTEMLSRHRFFQKLLTIKEEDDMVFENGGDVVARFKRVRARDGSVVLEYRLDQDAWVYVRSN